MELKLTGKYVEDYRKHADVIIDYFCEGLLCNEISAKLKEELGVNIPYQAITIFYKNNKEYIKECQAAKTKEKLNDIIENKSLDYAKAILYNILIESAKTLPEDVSDMNPDTRIKLIPTITNSLAKLEGLDKAEVNINNNSNSHETDDVVLEELLHVVQGRSD